MENGSKNLIGCFATKFSSVGVPELEWLIGLLSFYSVNIVAEINLPFKNTDSISNTFFTSIAK